MRPKYNTYGFGNSFVYIADIRNLVILDFSRGLPLKEREMLELNFFSLGL